MKVTFICLANSSKLGGRCLAGLRTDGNGWIRPVSQASSGTLSRHHYILDGGKEAELLDVIEMEVSNARPEPHQPENWVLGSTPWKLVYRIEPSKVLPLLCPFLALMPVLLGNQSDRVSYELLKNKPVSASLVLIEPSVVSWFITPNVKGNRQTRARFQLSGQHYDLVVTDPKLRERLAKLDWGKHQRAAADVAPHHRLLFTISLGEPFNSECYKLVAAVIVLPG